MDRGDFYQYLKSQTWLVTEQQQQNKKTKDADIDHGKKETNRTFFPSTQCQSQELEKRQRCCFTSVP